MASELERELLDGSEALRSRCVCRPGDTEQCEWHELAYRLDLRAAHVRRMLEDPCGEVAKAVMWSTSDYETISRRTTGNIPKTLEMIRDALAGRIPPPEPSTGEGEAARCCDHPPHDGPCAAFLVGLRRWCPCTGRHADKGTRR